MLDRAILHAKENGAKGIDVFCEDTEKDMWEKWGFKQRCRLLHKEV
jgi:hypothetical protein